MWFKRTIYENLLTHPREEKVKQYELVDFLHRLGNPIKVKEHKDGFPVVTVDCCAIHIITDCLTLDAWYAEKYPQGDWVDFSLVRL